ncbi:MAG: right-handed parallel beta-helix repeat-containing protein [Armatimonadota bacterium]|nr:right-handed parallel beta-helix repeat-containing protein [Armatimonadota bacterium]MDW8026288.1 right-handed parallel beta-helix repeat-containing protein [Armatimonadota bacterium]
MARKFPTFFPNCSSQRYGCVSLWQKLTLIVSLAFVAINSPAAALGNDWVEAMRKVHERFTGQKGTFSQFGDSITVTMAFWAPLPYARKNAPQEMERAFKIVNAYMRPECWRWKGAAYGNEGGTTVRWALEHVDGWLKRLNPEVALIMFGTNDLTSVSVDEYRKQLQMLVQKCLDNGTIVILSTIPPRSGFVEKSAAFAEVARQIASELKLPLVDYHSEILKRRPDDWDGSSEKFKDYSGYDVPTLISRDGVHPSHPVKYRDDYSEEALNCNGYSLRNYLVLLKYAEVIEKVLMPQKRANILTLPDLAVQDWLPKAPPLPPPNGEVIRVTTVNELFEAVRKAKPKTTILIADGFYEMPRRLEIRTDGLTLRGESGRREQVILDGGKHKLGELLAITACSDVTIADLTIQNVRWNGIKLDTDSGVHRVTIYNCILHNIWQRAVKGVKVPQNIPRPTGCRIQFCLFFNDRPKTFEDDPTDNPQTFNGNYVGGIDVMFAQNWVISDNVFIGIQGRTREGRGAIFLWHDSRDCVVERNIIIDCDVGIALGNSWKPPEIPTHCAKITVKNNFVTRCPESGIVADYTKDCLIAHNTIHDPKNRLGRLIRIVHDNDGLRVINNLLSGPPIRIESDSRMQLLNNLIVPNYEHGFVDAAKGNLRLNSKAVEAIDRAIPIPEVEDDIDGNTRGEKPDIGAHEALK